MVKNYQSKKEYLVLSMVKKYPLYSLNKLAKELPGISRHSIQRILEKNDLSRAEQRLEYAAAKKPIFLPVWVKLKGAARSFLKDNRFSFEVFQKISTRIQAEPKSGRRWARNLVILVGLFFIFWQGASFILAKPPEISLDQPKMDFVNKGEKLFVSGKVIPVLSRVIINNQAVSLNGDGSFTAVINIPLGESTLEVKAVNKSKKSEILRLVNREPTEEELKAQEEERVRKRKEAANRVAEIDRSVNDLLAAKNATVEQKGMLKVLNSRIKEETGFYSVVGEVANLGNEEVSWVMITAKFYNQTGGEVESRFGFATDFGEVIKPGEKAEFETQATTKEFDHYSLELSWEKGEVAGLTTTKAEEEATGSGETKEGESGF